MSNQAISMDSNWLHIADEDTEFQNQPIEGAIAVYYGIKREKETLPAIAIFRPVAYYDPCYLVLDDEEFSYSEKVIRELLKSPEKQLSARHKIGFLSLAKPHADQHLHTAVKAFDKIRDQNPALLGPARPISVIGRAIDWAYKNLP